MTVDNLAARARRLDRLVRGLINPDFPDDSTATARLPR
jgi:hypothetical protein